VKDSASLPSGIKDIMDKVTLPFAPFDLSELSTFRTQLMGVATVMIIVCHAEASNVLMPQILSRILMMGNYGVDIFLLLSGFGIFYSLEKSVSNDRVTRWSWYRRRLQRIFIPYLIVYIPYCIILMLLGKYSTVDSLMCLTTLEFWLYHRGAWYVSLIIILYLVAPTLFRMLNGGRCRYVTFSIVGVIMLLCNIAFDVDKNAPADNILFSLSRVPSFVVGMAFGKESREGKTIPVLWLIVLAFLFVAFFRYVHATIWMLIPLVTYLSVLAVKLIARNNWAEKSLCLLGKISLESYLTNITINGLLIALIPAFMASSLFYGRWLEYGVVVVMGIVVAYLTYIVSHRIERMIKI